MYSIYADDVCIYSDVFAVDNMKVNSPKLTLEDNRAGSLSVTLPAGNVGYDTVQRLLTDISVRKEGKEIWAGRILSENKDFYNNRVLYCEGELAFFNDSIQPPAQYDGYSVRRYLETLISIHNSNVPANRQFTIGGVTVHDADFPTYYTNYENTMTLLDALIERYGGHFRIRKENGIRYLDYLAEYPDTCQQTIQFGRNLIDFTRQWDSSDFATVIVPLGARLEDSPIEALDAYLTVEDVNDGSIYVQSDEAVAAYGRIIRTVTWDNVTDASILLKYAQAYLEDLQFDNMVIELSALDMHYLDVDVDAVELLDEIQVISRPHGLNRMFPVTKLEIPLDSPEKTQFKLGITERVSLTGASNQANAEILHRIEELPKAHNILKEAKENATAIMNFATTGYITITKDQYGSETLYISNIRDYTHADKLWKWNMNGLGYSNDGGKTFGLAMTMDGSIVADFITTGVMSANRVRTGVLESINKNVIFDLDAGTLVMKSGSISLGDYSNDSKHYQFEVDDTGRLYAGSSAIFAGTLNAAKGTFGGQLVAASGNFKGTVQAEAFLDASGNNMMTNGKWKEQYLELTQTNGEIETLKTTVSVMPGQIKAEVSATYDPQISDLSSNVTSLTSTMSMLPGQIKTEVSGTYDPQISTLNSNYSSLKSTVDMIPGQILAEVSGTYVTSDGLTERLKTSVSLNPDGILISNATGKKFIINTANNISMSFSQLTDAQTKELQIRAANTAADNAQSDASSALSQVSDLDIALTALKTDIGYTYIDGEYVISPNIVGGTITGARYYDLNSKASLVLNNTSAGGTARLIYGIGEVSSPSSAVFAVDADYGSGPQSLYLAGKEFLRGSTGRNDFLVEGTWNFSTASVTGLYLRFTN